jgi:hypothetical protein
MLERANDPLDRSVASHADVAAQKFRRGFVPSDVPLSDQLRSTPAISGPTAQARKPLWAVSSTVGSNPTPSAQKQEMPARTAVVVPDRSTAGPGHRPPGTARGLPAPPKFFPHFPAAGRVANGADRVGGRLEVPIEHLGGLVFRPWHEVAVPVVGLGDRRVSHPRLEDLGVEPAGVAHRRDHQRRKGVAALVQPDRVEAAEAPDALGAVEEPVVGQGERFAAARL